MTSKHQKKHRYPFKRNLSRKVRRILFMLVAAGIASGVNYYNNHNGVRETSLTQNHSIQFSENEQKQAINKIRNAKDNASAQFWVGFNGKIVQILKDDNSGSRHQKFLISPAPNLTLLVAHNIDLVSRVPINKGDTISLYGRYEWNNRGGGHPLDSS